MEATLIVGQMPTGHSTTISVQSAKVTIKMVKLSNNFGKNLWCTFTQMLYEKNVIFRISKYTAQQTSAVNREKNTIKKAL